MCLVRATGLSSRAKPPLAALRRAVLVTAAALAPAAACEARTMAQDTPAPPTAAAAEYARFQEQAAAYELIADGDERPLELLPQPLLNWGNPVRLQEHGSLVLWVRDARPQAIGSLFTYEHGEKVYDKHEFHSLSDRGLRLSLAGTVGWTPAAGGIEWRDLPEAPPPAAQPRQRLAQMRSLARRFTVVLSSPEGEPSELRLLSQPLYRYAEEREQILDGAILSFAVATDPEALLLLEAAGAPGHERYRYALARFHYWSLAAELDGATIWSAELDDSQALHNFGDAQHFQKAYVSFHPPAPPAP
jgi:hypothetical protein